MTHNIFPPSINHVIQTIYLPASVQNKSKSEWNQQVVSEQKKEQHHT